MARLKGLAFSARIPHASQLIARILQTDAAVLAPRAKLWPSASA